MPEGDRQTSRLGEDITECLIKRSKAKPKPYALGKGAAADLKALFMAS